MILASTLTTNLAILVLAGFIGFVVIGGLLLVGLPGLDGLSKALLVIAIAFGTINVVGGFLVTDRMLEMFKAKPKPKPAANEETKDGEGDS